MAGLNYFGLLRKRMSTAVLAGHTGMSVDDIKHCMPTGELEEKDNKKFKKLWKKSEKNRGKSGCGDE